MTVDHEKKSDGVRGYSKRKSDGVKVDYEKKSDRVRVDHEKDRWGERSPPERATG